MFQLYKVRSFSDLINDTFAFFRVHGKSYFKNYFIVNGGMLLVLLVLMYIVGQVFMDTIFSSFGTSRPDRLIEEYFNSNFGLFAGAMILGMLLILVLTLLSYSYPVIYLKLLETGKTPATKDIVSALWAKAGRMTLFSLLWLITFFPILIILSLLSLVLVVIMIGIPFAIIIFAAATSWMCLSFYDYLNNNTGYFEAMKNGFNMVFQNFWPHVGATAIFYIIVSVIHGIVSFVPYFIGIFSLLSESGGTSENPAQYSFFGLMVLLTFMLATAFSYILGNLLFVSQGMIYYSASEENENQSLHSEIDKIGLDSE